jgi:hypothetical protein
VSLHLSPPLSFQTQLPFTLAVFSFLWKKLEGS